MMCRALYDDAALRTIPLVFMSAVSLPPVGARVPYAAFPPTPVAWLKQQSGLDHV